MLENLFVDIFPPPNSCFPRESLIILNICHFISFDDEAILSYELIFIENNGKNIYLLLFWAGF